MTDLKQTNILPWGKRPIFFLLSHLLVPIPLQNSRLQSYCYQALLALPSEVKKFLAPAMNTKMLTNCHTNNWNLKVTATQLISTAKLYQLLWRSDSGAFSFHRNHSTIINRSRSLWRKSSSSIAQFSIFCYHGDHPFYINHDLPIFPFLTQSDLRSISSGGIASIPMDHCIRDLNSFWWTL